LDNHYLPTMTLYLVTGGAGFIGSNIVAELVRRGERVRVLDNFSTGRRANIALLHEHIDLVEGDLRDLPTVRHAVSGVDYVLHQGALPSVQQSIDDPLTTHAVNATGTLNLLLAAQESGVRRVVFASSCAVYGDDPILPTREDLLPAPKSPYAASKLAGERYCRVLTEVFGLETVCLRYFNVFGPRQDPASPYSAVIPLFVTAMLQGAAPTIYGDGRQSRDFVYVADVVQANLLAVDAVAATSPADTVGRVFNVACGQRHTLLDLVAALNDIMSTEVEPLHAGPRPGDIRHSLADVTAAREALGYQPAVDFHEGLRGTVAWYKEKRHRITENLF
jgi:UDP-glucose 4-epimerase